MDHSVNRRISQWVTPRLLPLRVTPNQVTLLSLAAGLIGAWHFQEGTGRAWLAGAVWLQVSYLLDNCDGELARMTGRSTGFGSWLDTIADCIVHAAFFFSLGLGISRSHSHPIWLWLGVLAAAGVFLTYLTSVLRQVRLRGVSAWLHPDPLPGSEPADFWGRARAALRADFSLVVLGSALVGQMAWLLWGGFFGAFLYWVSDALFLAARGRR